MVLPSGETSSDSQVPSSVENSILRSGLSVKPFFSSFFSSFFSPFLSFSCPAKSRSLAVAGAAAAPPKIIPDTKAATIGHTPRPRRPGCFTFIVLSSKIGNEPGIGRHPLAFLRRGSAEFVSTPGRDKALGKKSHRRTSRRAPLEASKKGGQPAREGPSRKTAGESPMPGKSRD